jgi:hypothetical protein
MPLVYSFHLQMQTQLIHEREENFKLTEELSNTNIILLKKQVEFDKKEQKYLEQYENELKIRKIAEAKAQQEIQQAQKAMEVFEEMKKLFDDIKIKMKAHEASLAELDNIKIENEKIKFELKNSNFQLEKATNNIISLKNETEAMQKNMLTFHQNEIQRIRNEVETEYLYKRNILEQECLERERKQNDKISALNDEIFSINNIKLGIKG